MSTTLNSCLCTKNTCIKTLPKNFSFQTNNSYLFIQYCDFNWKLNIYFGVRTIFLAIEYKKCVIKRTNFILIEWIFVLKRYFILNPSGSKIGWKLGNGKNFKYVNFLYGCFRIIDDCQVVRERGFIKKQT